MTTLDLSTWVDVCGLDDLVPDRGACAVVHSEHIALFRLATGEVLAIGNRDPFSGASVLSRGIVGDRGGVVKVASPVYRQSFALHTGACLDDPSVSVPHYRVRVRAGRVEVEVPAR